MKILFDMSTFKQTHQGGKDEVAYNLLMGFSELGKTNNIICVCKPEVKNIIKTINASYKVIAINNDNERVRPHWGYARKIQRIIDKLKIDCVVFTNKLAPCKKFSVPTILIPHDIQAVVKYHEERFDLKLLVYTLLIKENFKNSNTIVAISKFDKEIMLKYFGKYKNKIIQIYDPIVFKNLMVKKERSFITAINIQWPHKNIITLVKAYALISSIINEQLVLVGRLPVLVETQNEINNIIEKYKIKEKVVFTGYIEDKELEEIISNTRVYVNPSLFEGFGMTAIEMMGCGIPTIVANNTAMPESTMGAAIYYEPSTDEKVLAKVILNELNNPMDEKILKKISNRIKNKYNYCEISKKYYSLFEKVSDHCFY